LLAAAAAGSHAAFHWTPPTHFNWVRDYFDGVAARNAGPALRVVDDAGHDEVLSFAKLARRSRQVANFLGGLGIGPGDRVLIMLGNVVPLCETMLAVIRLSAVMIPATTLLQRDDLVDRLDRGRVKAIVAENAHASRFEGLTSVSLRIAVGGAPGWVDYGETVSRHIRLRRQPPDDRDPQDPEVPDPRVPAPRTAGRRGDARVTARRCAPPL